MKKLLLKKIDKLIWLIYYNAGELVHFLRQKYDYSED